MAASGSEKEQWPWAGDTPFIQALRKGSPPAASPGLGKVNFCNISLKVENWSLLFKLNPIPGQLELLTNRAAAEGHRQSTGRLQ